MTWQIVSAILAAGALIFLQWVRSRDAAIKALEVKNEALEAQAAEKREQERVQDEQEASEIVTADDVGRAIGFLRASFRKPAVGPVEVQPARVAPDAGP